MRVLSFRHALVLYYYRVLHIAIAELCVDAWTSIRASLVHVLPFSVCQVDEGRMMAWRFAQSHMYTTCFPNTVPNMRVNNSCIIHVRTLGKLLSNNFCSVASAWFFFHEWTIPWLKTITMFSMCSSSWHHTLWIYDDDVLCIRSKKKSLMYHQLICIRT
jgi:hypothetical protein